MYGFRDNYDVALVQPAKNHGSDPLIVLLCYRFQCRMIEYVILPFSKRRPCFVLDAFLLDGPETLLRHIGLDERDTYTTKHEIDDLVTVVHITREEAPAWQH